MTAIDPHRTLGLPPGASQAEIKRAYRHLAKLYHPDSAGERALPRFLAIQAAYEALVEYPGGRRAGGRAGSSYRAPEPPAHPWQADASRARATRESYRARTRRSSGGSAAGPAGGGTGTSPGAGTTGTRGPRPGAGSPGSGGRTADDRTAGGGPRSGPGSSGPAQAGRSRRSRSPKATIGSTSYDGADKEPFDPAWEGATWYGAGSGTYWTLNPKEYADPRKHGPEYLARSRRSRNEPASDPEARFGGSPGQGPADAGDTDSSPGVSDAAEPSETGHDRPADARPWPPSPAADLAGDTGRADRSAGWRPTVRPRPPEARPPEPRPPRPADASDLPGWRAATGGTRAGADDGLLETAPSGLRRASMSLPGRIGLAILGWIPLGVGISIVSDAVPACSGVVAVCSDPLRAGIWPIHLLLIGLLVALPRLGVIAAYGAGAFLLVGFGATPVLLAFGGAHTPAGTAAALGVVLIAAWVGGVALALSGRVELPPWRWPRVGGPRVR